MDLIYKFFGYIPFLLGGGVLASLIALAALWFIAPHLMPAVGKFITPISEFLADVLVKLGKVILHGISDIFDDAKTIVTFIICLSLVSVYYSYKYESNPNKSCEQQIKELRKDYRFVKRKKI